MDGTTRLCEVSTLRCLRSSVGSRPLIMKVAIVHNHPIHYKHLLFQALKHKGLELEVVFAARHSGVRHESLGLDQNLYKHRFAVDGRYETARTADLALGTWKAVARVSPDVLIIGGYHAVECWAAWAWGLLNKRPIVMWYESNECDYPNRPRHKEVLKNIFLKGCNLAQVYTEQNRSYLVKLGLRADRIDIKRAVVNVSAFSTGADGKSYSAGSAKRLLYVGRLAPEKNVGFLLGAIAEATRRAGACLWNLTIAGRGPLEEDLKEECVRLGIQDFVDFVGYCPQKDLPHLYNQADLCVIPSTREPWGLVGLEAMLCRVPVAISTQCGCAEDLALPETGWKFSPWKEAELVQILMRLSEMSPTDLAALGAAGHEIACGYSASACAERIIDSLQKVSNQIKPADGQRQVAQAR
jgi:glycosyltransferase involved in cell wall biosynthesis